MPRIIFLFLLILAGLGLAVACGGPGPAIEAPATEPALPAAAEAPGPAPAEFDLQAHRGGRGIRPENTLPAFEYALDQRVTTLELDLHLTLDGQVVVIHDAAIGRHCRLDPQANAPPAPDPQAADVDEAELLISRLTLAQIRQYQCDGNPNPSRFPHQAAATMPLTQDNYRLPTLAEVFQLAADYAASDLKTGAQRRHAAGVRFNIETKRKPGQPELIADDFDGQSPGLFEERIVEIVQQFDLVDRVTIQSFDHRSINVIAQLDPAIQTVALTSRPADPAGIARQTTAAVWSPNHETLTARGIEAAHEAGLAVIPWTVNDPDRMGALIDLGVDGLITDFPAVLAAILEERGIAY
ncbi:MAG: glycerophosphodiester phosphodiesterase family protein [Anaerolineae bacterium]